jgi:monoamine oxidase
MTASERKERACRSQIMPISRRQLLGQMTLASAASLLAGNLAAQPAPARIDTRPGRRVAVVGAGIAGLVAAYELHKANLDVTLLEARQRVGGRNWTLRRGDSVVHDDGSVQTVGFAQGLYFNAGPARIMSHHHTILGYCRELGVALEPLINDSRNALLASDPAAAPLRQRQVRQDAKGRLSEWLLGHLASGAAPVSGEQAKALGELLRAYGDLDASGRYQGSLRAADLDFPRLGAAIPQPPAPLDWAQLLDPQLRAALIEDDVPEYAASMFQPVGGMDRLAKALARPLNGRIRLGAELTAVTVGERSNVIAWREAGQDRHLQVDYLILALPLHLLAKTANNLPAPVQRILASRASQQANKVAWQAPRFWERNDHIYGGLSRPGGDAQLLWYPSDGFNTEQGVLIGAYNQGQQAGDFARLPLAEQYARSRQAVASLHPGQSASLHAPVAVNWGRIPYSQGAWPLNDAIEPLLSHTHGRTWLAGDGVAHGGQEGAADSARRAVAAILAQLAQEAA